MRITDFLPRGVFPASAALLLACGGPSQQAARTPVSLVQATDAVLESCGTQITAPGTCPISVGRPSPTIRVRHR